MTLRRIRYTATFFKKLLQQVTTHLSLAQFAAQFADDMKAFLPSLDKVPQFISAMITFGTASGQCLKPDKTKIPIMGNLTGGRGPHINSLDAGSSNMHYTGGATLNNFGCLN